MDATEITHPAFSAAAEAVADHIGRWEIPDDGTGILDTDSYLASIAPFLGALADVLADRAEYLAAETPVASTVAETLRDFAGALRAMADDAAQVHHEWATNPDNEYDLRRARGEVPNAQVFNV